MRLPLLVDATDLEHWADRRDAQALLPDLVRRLVLGTASRLQRTSFRAGEGTQLEGWDGIVWAEQGNAFIPDGVSGWEEGSGRNPLDKANDDYHKRTGNPHGLTPSETVFGFVTPRRWPGKDDWARARQSEGVWREVRAYDGDDLEAWLSLAPPVHLWLSSQLGEHPLDAQDMESLWVDWAAETQPATPVDLALAGRGSVVQRIAEWLRASHPQLSLEAESREEALAVFAAALHKLPAEAREAAPSRAAVVRSETSIRWVSGSKASLILVLDLDSRGGGGHAVALGHRVDRARDLAALAQLSLLAFRRKLAVIPGLQRPAWARPEHGRSLLPALLAGAWSGGSHGDRDAVEQLAGVPYDELEAVMARWANEPDPPVRPVGEVWYLVSREDAWLLLARYLTRDDLKRFAKVTLAVLGTPDPQYELPPEKRWQASVLGHASPWSGLFRRGIAETLAVMAAREATTEEGHISLPSQCSTRVARDLLNRADADWRVWASLSPALPLLAEAGPDAFLEAVDRGLGGDPPVL